MRMISSMNRSEFPLYGKGDSSNSVTSIGFDHFVSDDIMAPLPVGRESGSGSPSSLEGLSNNNNSNNCAGGIGSISQEDATKYFPFVLHSIVSDEQSDNAIHWLPCGTRFVIANKEEFSKNILPHYFGSRSGTASSAGATTKFTSFTRRLKRWNFSRVPSGREMGAYFHESFRRGEPELARKIMYPVSKSGSGPATAGGKSVSGGKEKKVVKAKSTVRKIPKAQRRASTGSMIPVAKFFNEAAILDISPAPIHMGPVQGAEDILPLPLLENDANDMKQWLTSSDFMAMANGLGPLEPTPSSTPSLTGGAGAPLFDLEPPASVVSNNSSQAQTSFLLPPPAFPKSVVSGGIVSGRSSQQGEGLYMPSPRTMRRHSVTLGNLSGGLISMPPMMIGSSGINTNHGSGMAKINSFTGGAPGPLLGSNFCGEAMPVSSISANINNNNMTMSGSSSLHMQPMAVKTKTGMRPMPTQSAVLPVRPDHTDSIGRALQNDDCRSISSFSREFSFDDLKMIDPFT